MKIKILLALLCLSFAPLLRADDGDSASDGPTATAIEVSGQAVYEAEDNVYKPIQLGQLFGEGDHVVTKEDGGLHLVLADGSSLVLGPNTEMTLDKIGAGDAGSQTLLQLIKGTCNAIVEKLKLGSSFELHSPNAVAAVKGTQFEVSDDGSDSAISVHEGIVATSDPQGLHSAQVTPLFRASFGRSGFRRPMHMSDREIDGYEHRWAHARLMHGRRAEIMRPFARRMRERRAALRARRPLLMRRMQNRRAGGMRPGGGHPGAQQREHMAGHRQERQQNRHGGQQRQQPRQRDGQQGRGNNASKRHKRPQDQKTH
jgi:hypothetical protein